MEGISNKSVSDMKHFKNNGLSESSWICQCEIIEAQVFLNNWVKVCSPVVLYYNAFLSLQESKSSLIWSLPISNFTIYIGC